MKLFIVALLFTTYHFVSSQEGVYTPVEPENGQYSQEVENLREYGAQQVTQRAIDAGEMPSGDYSIAETYSVERQIVDGLNYRYDVELANRENVRVRTTYVVYYQPWTDTREVESYSIDWVSSDEGIIVEEEAVFDFEEEFLFEEEEVVGGYTPLDPDYVQDDEFIQGLLAYGVDYVTEKAAAEGRLPNSRFTISKIFGVERQVVDGANYRCDVEITDGEGLYVRTHYTIYSQPWTGTREVTYYDYEITAIPGNDEFEGEKYVEVVYQEEEEIPVEEPVYVEEVIVKPEEAIYVEEAVVYGEKDEEKEEEKKYEYEEKYDDKYDDKHDEYEDNKGWR